MKAKEAIKALDKKFEARDKNWRKMVLKMYMEGATDRSVLCALEITPTVWSTLYEDDLDSDFRELVDLGRLYAHTWWEDLGRTNLHNPKFQVALYKFQMNNRYGWTEKSEQSMTTIDFKNMDDEELMREISKLNGLVQSGRGKGSV